MKSTFARRISILLVLAMVLAMLPLAAMAATPTTLYLKPGPWNTANAWYSAYFYVDDTTNTHAAMADTDGDGVYEVTVPEGDWTNVIFLRNDPADQVADWTGVWNQSADLAIPTDGTNMYTVTGWNAGDGAWSEYVYVEPAFYVCGTMNSWTLSYADHKMVKGDDGVYSLTLTLAAGTYEFKVNDGTWGSSWGKDGGSNNIEFVLTEESNVTITFDVATKVPVVTSSAMGEVETFDYYLRGSMNEWTVSSATGMAKNDDGTYSITIDMVAGTYEYKADSGDWTDCYPVVGEPNATVTVVTDCAVTFVLDTTAGTITVTGDGLGETPVDPTPEELVVDKVVIAGGVAGDNTADPGNMFNGQIWAVGEDITVNKLYDNEDGIYSITFSQVLAGTYAFKFVVNDNWSINFATGLEVTSGVEETAWFNALGDSTVVVTEDGSKVTFVLDLSNTVYVGDNALMTVTVEAPASIDENVAPEQIVIGDNEFAVATGNREPVTAPYTATYTGTLYIYPTAMTVINWMGELEEVPSESINMQFGRMYGIVVDGVTVWGNQVEVVEGQTYQIGIFDSIGGGCEVTLTVCSGHNFVDDTCSVCGYVCSNHNWDEGTCLICGTTCAHETWDGGWCTNCWMQCEHSWTYTYTKNSTHKFTCSGICGCEVSIADTDGKKFAINSAAPLLSDDIVMKYSVTVPTGFEEAYMVFDFNGESFYTFEYEVATNGRYEFKFPGINPQKMGDNICATLYATIDGVQVYVRIANYSMVKNCDNQLKKSNLDAKTRTMLSDVLMYGEKAQIVTNYKTDVLVTSLLSAASTLTPSTYPDALDSSVDMQKRTGTTDDRIKLTGVTLSLGSKMAVRVAVTCTDTSLFTYKVTISGREYTYTGEDLVPVNDGSDGKYYLFFNQMKATEFGEKITFTCWEGETQVGHTMEYSVYTFIYRNMSKVNADTQELLKAIYNYGESVK